MGQTSMKAPLAAESSEVEASRKALNAAVVALKSALEATRLKPNELTTRVDAVFTALQDYNNKLKPFNNGTDAISIKGSTYTERLASMNQWLGVPPTTTPLDPIMFTKLDAKLAVAAGVVQQQAAAEEVAQLILPPEAKVAAAPAEAKAAPAETKPQLAVVPVSTAGRYDLLLDNLDYINNYGRPNDKARATKLADGIRSEQDEAKLKKFVADANKLVSSGLKAAQNNAAAINKDEMLKTSGVLPLFKEMQALAVTKPLANTVANDLAADMWNLGEKESPKTDDNGRITAAGKGPRWMMYGYLVAAADAIRNNNEKAANSYLAAAKSIYDQQQQQLHQPVLQESIRVLEELLARFDTFQKQEQGKRLPTKADLKVADSYFEKGKKNKATRKSKRDTYTYVYNYAETIRADISTRLENARKYSQAKGRLSADFVVEFNKYTMRTEAALDTLMGLWTINSQGSKSVLSNPQFMSKYGECAMAFVNPSLDPFQSGSFSPAVKNSIRTWLSEALGRPRLSDQEIAKQLQSNPHMLFFMELGRMWEFAIKTAPKPDDKVAPALASLDSLRIYHTRQYVQYTTGEFTDPVHTVHAAATYLQDTVEAAENAVAAGAVPKEAMAETIRQARLHLDKYTGQRDKANYEKADPAQRLEMELSLLKVPDKKWQEKYAKAGPEEKSDMQMELRNEVADPLVRMASGLSAITHLEILLHNEGYRATSVTEKSEEYRKARAVADSAKEDFSIRFGSGRVLGLYPALPDAVVSAAVKAISPPAIYTTDRLDLETVGTAYDMASEHCAELATNTQLNQLGNPIPTPEDVAWKAQQADRWDATKAAYNAEIGHVMLLRSLRDKPEFGSIAAKRAVGDAAPVLAMQSPLLASISDNNLREPLPSETWTVRADTTAFIGKPAHEILTIHPLGMLFVETQRQRKASREDQWPVVLRQLDSDPAKYGAAYVKYLSEVRKLPAPVVATATDQYAELGKTVQAISAKISPAKPVTAGEKPAPPKPILTAVEESANNALVSTHTPQQKLEWLNYVSVGYLRVRIAELETRLKLQGPPEQQKDATGRLYVEAAQRWLKAAQAVEKELAVGYKTDLLTNRVDFRKAVMQTEDAIHCLNKLDPIVKETNVKAFHLVQDSVDISKERIDERGVGMPSTGVVAEFHNGKLQPLQDYERPLPLSKRPNLSYRWFYYSDPEGAGKNWFLVNPKYDPNSTKAEERIPYLGRVIGNTVVKIKPRGSGRTVEYDTEMQGGNPVVLFHIKPGPTGRFTGVPDRSDSVKLAELNASENRVSGSSPIPVGRVRWVGSDHSKMRAAVLLHEPGKY